MFWIFLSNILLLSVFLNGGLTGVTTPANLISSDDKAFCVKEIKEFTVRGGSMTDLINQGEKVKILFGFYGCNEIARGDVVAYDYKGNSNLVIKSVKGLSGDRLKIIEGQDDAGARIEINGETVSNSKGEPYNLDEQEKKMIALYEKDYKGIIPPNSYLILGNLASGSTDSTRFGLVDRGEIVGKVLKE